MKKVRVGEPTRTFSLLRLVVAPAAEDQDCDDDDDPSAVRVVVKVFVAEHREEPPIK